MKDDGSINIRKVQSSELIKLAKSYGHSHHWIERQITNRLIPPAMEIKSRGPKRGTHGIYPWKTYTGLHALCCLVNKQYKNKELRFALWLMGVAEWRDSIRDYLIRVIMYQPEQISSYAKEQLMQQNRNTGKPIDDYRPRNDEVLTRKDLGWEDAQESVMDLLSPIIDKLNSFAHTQNLQPFFEMDDRDQVIDLTKNFVFGKNIFLSNLSQTFITQLFSQQSFIETINESNMEDFTHARNLIYGVASESLSTSRSKLKSIFSMYRLLLRKFQSVWTEAQSILTIHQKQRLGPWRHPELAHRAILFTYLLQYIRLYSMSQTRAPLPNNI